MNRQARGAAVTHLAPRHTSWDYTVQLAYLQQPQTWFRATGHVSYAAHLAYFHSNGVEETRVTRGEEASARSSE